MSRMHPFDPVRVRAAGSSTLTRRGFLEQLGAVGGSSLVFSAMTSWDLMAGSAGQKPELTGRPAKSKVLVLGGGLSGMVVGYELGKLGYDYQVLEARDRVGGLQWAVKTRRRAHRGRRRAAGLRVRRGAVHQRRAVAHSVLAHRGAELLPGTERAAAGVPQRIGRELFLLRRQRRGAAVEQEGPAARDQGRRHRPHQRAVREGDRSGASSICR